MIEQFHIQRSGLAFERSGDSMAVFQNGYRIDRWSLNEASESAFLEAVDLWLQTFPWKAAA